MGGGPAEITLEDYKGLTYEVAEAQLRQAKLVPARQDVNNPAPAGTVLGSNPKAGGQVNEGARITLQVSNGRSALPKVVGKSDEEATKILNEAGWTNIKRITAIPPSDFDAGTVFRTDPTGETFVGKDATITLYLAAEKPTPTPTTPSPSPSSSSPSPTGSPPAATPAADRPGRGRRLSPD